MKLELKNVGRIRSASIDIKPLTIFIGPNNTNKTWAAYSLYALLETLRFDQQRFPASMQIDPRIEAAVAKTAQVLRTKLSEMPQSAELRARVRREDVLSTEAQGQLVFTLTAPGVRAAVSGPVRPDCSASLVVEGQAFKDGPISELRIQATQDQDSLLIEYWTDGAAEPSAGSVLSLHQLEAELRGFLLASHFSVRCLPAERTLLAQIYTALVRPGGAADGLPRPLVDFVYMMGLNSRQPINMVGDTHKPVTLLTSVTGGRYAFAENGSKILFTPKATPGLDIPLTATSSLAKSLAGLDVFLRNARRGDVLLIDEPEMNAHPDAVVRLTELLAIVANQGVNVVITTHSPYIVDHLTNLMEAATLPEADQQAVASKFWLKSRDACIPAEKVATYYFADRGEYVEVTDALDRTRRDIDWSTFSDVGDRVTNLLADILDLKPYPPASPE